MDNNLDGNSSIEFGLQFFHRKMNIFHTVTGKGYYNARDRWNFMLSEIIPLGISEDINYNVLHIS